MMIYLKVVIEVTAQKHLSIILKEAIDTRLHHFAGAGFDSGQMEARKT